MPILWVMHRNEGNIELHFLAPKMEATTGKAFNIAPPGEKSQQIFENFQKFQNEKFGFKQVTPNLLTAQFDVFEKRTRKGKFSHYLTKKVRANKIQNRTDLLRHLQHDLHWKVSRVGEDFISVIPAGRTRPIRLKGPAFTSKADYRDMLKQSSNFPTKLSPDELLKITKNLNNGIKARTNYNLKNYINLPNYKNRALNLKGKTQKTIEKNIVPNVPAAQHKVLFEEKVSNSKPLKTALEEFSSSTHASPPTKEKKANTGRSRGSSSGSSGSITIDIQIASVKAQMNSERDPVRKAQLLTQLLALQTKKEQMLLQEHNDKIKKINKLKP